MDWLTTVVNLASVKVMMIHAVVYPDLVEKERELVILILTAKKGLSVDLIIVMENHLTPQIDVVNNHVKEIIIVVIVLQNYAKKEKELVIVILIANQDLSVVKIIVMAMDIFQQINVVNLHVMEKKNAVIV